MFNKKVLSLFVLSLMLISVFSLIVSAQITTTTTISTTVSTPITEPGWVVDTANFLNLVDGNNAVTWAIIIISLAILAMLFAACYDILELTAFQNNWVKLVISSAIALIVAVSGGVSSFIIWMINRMGDSIIIALTVVLVVAIFFFIGNSFIKGKIAQRKLEKQEHAVNSALDSSANMLGGLSKMSKKIAKNEMKGS